jgi:hypothetical protein
MESIHPTADGIGRCARSIPRAARLLALVVLVAAVAAGVSAQAAFADEAVQLTVSPAAVPVNGLVTMTANVTSTLDYPDGTISFINTLAPSSSPALAQFHVMSTGARSASAQFQTTALPQGTYSIEAVYAPTSTEFAIGLRSAQSAPQTLTVGTPTPATHDTQVVLTTPSLTVDSTKPVTFTATVSELAGSAVPTGTVSFSDIISGSPIPLGSGAVPLNASGIAQLTVPFLAVGPHQIVASYSGGGLDNSSGSQPLLVNSAAPVDARLKTVATVVVTPSPIAAGDTATITATIVQITPSGSVTPAGGSVTFTSDSVFGRNVFLGSGALGTAPAPLTAPPNQVIIRVAGWQAGSYSITASYFGDIYGKDSSAVVPLAVVAARTDTSIVYSGDTTVAFGHTATLAATITDRAGTPFAGRSVTFTLGSQSCTATSNAAGKATCSLLVAQDPGNIGVSISVPGDTKNLPAQLHRDFTVTPALTALSVGFRPGLIHTALTATLLSDTRTPISGQVVSLTLEVPTLPVESCSATTNGAGFATCDVDSIPNDPTATLTATYAGNLDYFGSGASRSVQLAPPPAPTTLVVGPIIPMLRGTQTLLSATLLDDGRLPIANESLTLTLGSQSCTHDTDGNGVASCTVTVSDPPGPATVMASFAGDDFHLATSASISTFIYALPPGGSTFVVGDQSATGAVTFWGAKWSKLNRVSLGDAPDAFKGFALVAPLTCGTRWTTGPGNSPDPPAGTLPAYMAVLVTSSVTKSGSSISGTTTHIVIVKTDAGYKNDPGHAGTGTVVATVC